MHIEQCALPKRNGEMSALQLYKTLKIMDIIPSRWNFLLHRVYQQVSGT
jgi:hypothetical protein